MKKLFLLPALILSLASIALGSGTLTGTLTTPSTSVPITNALLTFSLSQAGVDVSQSYNLASTPFTCATDGSGGVVGIKNPAIAAAATPVISTGSIPNGTYYLAIAYADISGHKTLLAPYTVVSMTGGNNTIVVTGPALHPFGAVGYNIYMGTVLGTYHLQAQTGGFGNTTLQNYNSSGIVTDLNNTVCSFTFNDAIIPSYTYYSVSIINSNGANVSGFPQNWYLQGSTVNIATIIPITNQNARFPTPILSNPLSSYATQSINSPVTLNGYGITVGNLIASGYGVIGASSKVFTDAIFETKVTTDKRFGIVNGTVIGGADGIGLVSYDDLATTQNSFNIGGSMLNYSSFNVIRWKISQEGHARQVANIGTITVAGSTGTMAFVSGSVDSAGKINITSQGAGDPTITVTFGTSYSKAPACSVVDETTTLTAPLRYTSTTTTLVIRGIGVLTNDVLAYTCTSYGT